MAKYFVAIGEWESYIVNGEESRNKCIRYLLKKWKEELPDEMVFTKKVPDAEEVTWPIAN